MSSIPNFWDVLSPDEATFMQDEVIRALTGQQWADRLIKRIKACGKATRANKALFFELRFGYALHQAGVLPDYERSGEGNSTLDFEFASRGKQWRVELMRLEETAAVRSATDCSNIAPGIQLLTARLSSDAKDPKESEEGETLKAIQRICQKCEKDGKPHKFPIPQEAYHAILVDFRTFPCGDGGDQYDQIHVGLGGASLPERYRLYWDGQLIEGVFSSKNTQRGASEIRERVHFIGFVNEDTYESGAFGKAIQFIANPALFKNGPEARAALATWPLQPAKSLNCA